MKSHFETLPLMPLRGQSLMVASGVGVNVIEPVGTWPPDPPVVRSVTVTVQPIAVMPVIDCEGALGQSTFTVTL
ncbi:MAG: hypothetical protein JOZ87_40675 [Chloroflexi bacterium]|nr:hypothetical protein [Chloroflexota bacterium]